MQALDRTLELDIALLAVERAALAAMAVRAQMGERGAGTITKEDRSPVTVADFAAQAVVAATLQEAFRNDPLVGEEDSDGLRGDAALSVRSRVVEAVGRALSRSVAGDEVLTWLDRGNARGDTDRYWVLDPIDGTKGFLRGGQFAIALALVEHGEVTAAVLGCPAYDLATAAMPGLILGAVRGQGSFEVATAGAVRKARRPIRVADAHDVSSFRVCESVESGHTD
ncbi:MAG: inositol monophosphatase family protein, partial [Planctomycetota bacterium]